MVDASPGDHHAREPAVENGFRSAADAFTTEQTENATFEKLTKQSLDYQQMKEIRRWIRIDEPNQRIGQPAATSLSRSPIRTANTRMMVFDDDEILGQSKYNRNNDFVGHFWTVHSYILRRLISSVVEYLDLYPFHSFREKRILQIQNQEQHNEQACSKAAPQASLVDDHRAQRHTIIPRESIFLRCQQALLPLDRCLAPWSLSELSSARRGPFGPSDTCSLKQLGLPTARP